jgi:hypothetical protein
VSKVSKVEEESKEHLFKEEADNSEVPVIKADKIERRAS